MANRRARRGRKRGGRTTERDTSLQFSRINGLVGAGGLLSLALGYWLLAQGSITAAPLLLVLGYVVLLPLAILL